MAQDVLPDIHDSFPVLSRPAAEVGKVYTVLPLAESNGGGAGSSKKPGGKAFGYYVVGNELDANVAPLSSGLALVGGGTDVDAVFTWMGAKANGGDFVVIRASGTEAYNPYIDALVPSLDSVATLVISSLAGANDPAAAALISQAEAIFIAGGDQADYINFWKNTAVESAIYQAIARGAPIGGTSAGLAVLSEFDFAARNGTITSTEALANPYDPQVDIDSGFLNEPDFVAAQAQPSVLRYLDHLITDSHFQQRDRMGRLITFMARLDQDGLEAAPRGLGINEQTAVLIEPTGIGQVVGNPYATGKKAPPIADQRRAAYLIATTANTTQNVAPGQSLTYTDLAVLRFDYNPTTGLGDTFDFYAWTNFSGDTSYEISSLNGNLSTQFNVGLIY